MMRQLRFLVWNIRCFGILTGVKLFFFFITQKTENMSMPLLEHTFTLRPGTSDLSTFVEVFMSKGYDIVIPFQPKTVIDGGANVGMFSIKMKNDFPDALVVAVEPDPDNYRILQKNTNPYSNIQTVQAGLWGKDTQLKVWDKFEAGKNTLVVEEAPSNGTIPGISIDTLMQTFNLNQIDILKLDIETSEKQLFFGNCDWLSKTKMIIIELHDKMEEGCSQSFFEAINRFIKHYDYAIHGENTIITNRDLIPTITTSTTVNPSSEHTTFEKPATAKPANHNKGGPS